MEIRHLRYFTAVAENLHFGLAARQLNISQPPLSQQIRELEEELGVQLFWRNKRRVQLTEAGRVFLQETKLILEQTSHAIRAVQRTNCGEIGQLTVGFVMSATCTVLPDVLRTFGQRYPGVELVLKESTTGEGIAALKEKKMHLCFLRLPARDEALDSKTLLSERMLLAIPKGHPFSDRSTVSLRLLEKERFIIFPRSQGSDFYDLIVSACHQSGFSPKVVQEAAQMQTILSLVAAGIGISLVPESVWTLRKEGVCYKPLLESFPETGIVLAWLRGPKPPIVDHFIEQATLVTRHCPH
jgi:DNA-binding transcriptional LysR family regulator